MKVEQWNNGMVFISVDLLTSSIMMLVILYLVVDKITCYIFLINDLVQIIPSTNSGVFYIKYQDTAHRLISL